MNHFRKLGSQFSISLAPDEEGFIGRECPVTECEGYFKIQPGTGLQGENLTCHCPYCGHEAGYEKFFTKAQVEHAQSVVMREVTSALLKDLKTLEFNNRPRGAFGLGISVKVAGQPTAIRRYRESKLETEVVCDRCKLRYAIYGVFGFCPDCAAHNSLQILSKNLELVQKFLVIAETQEAPVAQHFIENALEDCVSAFDGFGRETCRIFAEKAIRPERVAGIRFQNIAAARARVKEQFCVDFGATVAHEDWKRILRAFPKRHLLAHKMGVEDAEYLSATDDSLAVLGHKIEVSSKEVNQLVTRLKFLGDQLFTALQAKQ